MQPPSVSTVVSARQDEPPVTRPGRDRRRRGSLPGHAGACGRRGPGAESRRTGCVGGGRAARRPRARLSWRRSTIARSASKPGSSRPLPASPKRSAGAALVSDAISLERQAASLGDGEQRAPERLAAGDAAPDRERIITLLQLRRRRRVVGRDDRDRAREQLRPERLDLDARPQRRRALGERADALRVLVGEQEVVGTRLAGHVDATGARLGDEHAPRRPCSRGRCAASSRSPPRSRSRAPTASSSAATGRDAR